jgi:hypothetical protein
LVSLCAAPGQLFAANPVLLAENSKKTVSPLHLFTGRLVNGFAFRFLHSKGAGEEEKDAFRELFYFWMIG